jgi:hypothetical protein
MSTSSTDADPRGRPKLVDYAMYALIARCVCSLGEVLALHGARDEVGRSLADANKDKQWSAATLQHNVDVFLRGKLINAVVTIVVIAILVKFLREGRNWARLLYLAFAILAAGDLFAVLGFFQYHDFLARTMTGLVGVSSLAALVLLFLPDSNGYFRPAAAGGGLLGSMFRPRGMPAAGSRPGPATRPTRTGTAHTRVAEAGPATAAVQPASGTESGAAGNGRAGGVLPPDSAPGTPATGDPADRRPAPRGKSRQSGQPKRSGSR